MARKHAWPVHRLTTDGLAVSIDEVETAFLTQLAGWKGFAEAAARALGPLALDLPDDCRSPVRTDHAVVWRIAPDRILIRSRDKPDIKTMDDLVALDLSDARIGLSIAGPGAGALLSRVIAMDFAEEAFPVGGFAQTSLHQVGVLVDRQSRDRFTILVPTTWAASLTDLLIDHLPNAA